MPSNRLVKSFDALLRDTGSEYTGDDVVQGIQRELNKAMTTAGVISGGGAAEDATNLRLQNLDATLTSVLFTNRHLKLFNAFPRVPSIQQFFEYNVRVTYGGGRSMAGFTEGGGPKGGTASWQRKNGTVKWLGVLGGVTHQLLTTGMLGGTQLNPVEEENRNRTMELLEKLERNIIWGLASLPSDDANLNNYDGFMQQMGALGTGSGTVAPSNVMDLQGSALSFDTLEEIAEKLYTNAYIGSLDEYDCFLSPGILSDLSKIRLGTGTTTSANPTQRHLLDGQAGGVVDGIPMNGFMTNYGFIRYEPSIFLAERVRSNRPFLAANEITALQTADAGAPATPVAPTMANGVDATSLLPGSVVYHYVVSACNDAGESLGKVDAGSITSVSGDKITVTITQVTSANYYRIYRTNGG